MLTFICEIARLGIDRSATHSPIFQTFFDYRQGIRESQPFGDCEIQLMEFDASRVPYDVALDITDDPDHGDYRLMLIVRADMYTRDDAELLLTSYQKLVHSFTSTPDVPFGNPDIFKQKDLTKALAFGQGKHWPPLAYLCASRLPRCSGPFSVAFVTHGMCLTTTNIC